MFLQELALGIAGGLLGNYVVRKNATVDYFPLVDCADIAKWTTVWVADSKMEISRD
jgi:hypothetical protein